MPQNCMPQNQQLLLSLGVLGSPPALGNDEFWFLYTHKMLC